MEIRLRRELINPRLEKRVELSSITRKVFFMDYLGLSEEERRVLSVPYRGSKLYLNNHDYDEWWKQLHWEYLIDTILFLARNHKAAVVMDASTKIGKEPTVQWKDGILGMMIDYHNEEQNSFMRRYKRKVEMEVRNAKI